MFFSIAMIVALQNLNDRVHDRGGSATDYGPYDAPLEAGAPTKSFLSSTLGSHMVLQRAPKQAALWGWCSPTQAVTVQLDQQPAVRATADGTGFWKVTLAPQSAGVGHVIVITCADGARAMLAGEATRAR